MRRWLRWALLGGAWLLPVAGQGQHQQRAQSAWTLEAALAETLAQHPAIRVARAELAETAGQARAAWAPLDWTIEAQAGHDMLERGLPPSERVLQGERSLTTQETRIALGLDKRFGLGTRLTPTLSLARTDSARLPVDGGAGAGLPALNRAEARLALTQPLLRGRGTRANLGPVHAAERTRDAAREAVREVVQRRLVTTAVAYWSLVVATREVELFDVSVARNERMLEETRELVEADQRPRGDLRQLEGNLAARRRAALRARSGQVQASHQLRLAMGRQPRGSALLVPADDFPGDVPASDLDREALVRSAVARRPELLRSEHQRQAAQLAAAAAEVNAGPALDLTLHVGYAGYVNGDAPSDLPRALGNGVSGLDAGVLLSLSLPVHNFAYGGARDAAIAARDAARERRENLARTVRTEVLAANDQVAFARRALREAMRAEAQFRQALQDERDKLRAGLSTVIDVVLTEELTTQAQFDRVHSEYELALALLELRRATGGMPERVAQVAPSVQALLGKVEP